MKEKKMKMKSLLLCLFTTILFISCQKDNDEIEPVSTNGTAAESAVIIGDWVYTRGGGKNVYRFQNDGTVLIGRNGYGGQAGFFYRNLYAHLYGSEVNNLKFHFKSSWTIENNSLKITGDLFSNYDVYGYEGADTKGLNLDLYFSNHKERFEKDTDNTYNFDKIYDLTQAQLNISSFDGKWIINEDGHTLEIQNGQVGAEFNYDDITRTLTPINGNGTTRNYFFLTPDFPGQTLGRKVYYSGTNIFSESYSNTRYIVDFTLDQSGKLIQLSLNDNIAGTSLGQEYVRLE